MTGIQLVVEYNLLHYGIAIAAIQEDGSRHCEIKELYWFF